jgi:hypothetical protein
MELLGLCRDHALVMGGWGNVVHRPIPHDQASGIAQ